MIPFFTRLRLPTDYVSSDFIDWDILSSLDYNQHNESVLHREDKRQTDTQDIQDTKEQETG